MFSSGESESTVESDSVIDVVGIGIGPSNLSAAALLAPLGGVSSAFVERRNEFQWYPGLLFPEATIQVCYIKDLVTLADPTSPYSFLSFLHKNQRLYRFLHSAFPRVTRLEFNQYFRWVADSLPNVTFGCCVEAVRFEEGVFWVDTIKRSYRSRNLLLGTGLRPRIPSAVRPFLGPTVFLGYEYLERNPEAKGLRVAVVGGGQTGAEVVSHLLSCTALPESVIWISRRSNFFPLDESPFSNELFTPGYSEYFYRLESSERQRLLSEQKLASDGISATLLESIYRRLYELEFLQGHKDACELHAGCELTRLESTGSRWHLTLTRNQTLGFEELEADLVIICAGLEYQTPEFLGPLMERISWTEAGFSVREDFSIDWDGPMQNRIYVQNAARRERGVADPNLSLMAWRSAMIVNSILGKARYRTEEPSSLLNRDGKCVSDAKRGRPKELECSVASQP
jgi:lysine N6-hydroxylase